MKKMLNLTWKRSVPILTSLNLLSIMRYGSFQNTENYFSQDKRLVSFFHALSRRIPDSGILFNYNKCGKATFNIIIRIP